MLPDCLESCRNWVDEIILTDTGSTDGTKRIAKRFNATVVDHIWQDDFSAARNACVAQASGDWVLVLDADERLAPGAGALLQQLTRQPHLDYALMPIHNASHIAATPEQIMSGLARRSDPVLIPRFFRRTQDLRWNGVVHENVTEWLAKGRNGQVTDANILHFGNIPRIRKERQKSNRNLRLLERRCIVEPNNPIARARLARELLRVGDNKRATQEIEWAWMDLNICWARTDAALKPQPTEVATLRAFMALNNGRTEAAFDTATQALQWGDDHPNLHLLRAASIEQTVYADPVDKIRALNSAWDSASHCLELAGVASTVETLPGATSWAALTVRGLIELQLEQLQNAQKSFNMALAQRPDHQPAQLGQAEVQARMGATEKSLKTIEPLLEANVADAWIVAADLAARSHRFEDVILFLERAEHNRPDPVRSVHRAARANELRMFCQAWRLYCRTTQEPFSPRTGDVESLVEQAEACFNQGDFDAAVARLFQAITVDLLHPTAWQDLAVVAHRLGLRDGAGDLLRFALELAPDNMDIQINLAELYRDSAQPWMAVDTCRTLLSQHPGDTEAIQFLEELAIGSPTRPVAFFVVPNSRRESYGFLMEQCRQQGYQVRYHHPEVYQALSRRQYLMAENEVTEQFRRNQPALTIIDESEPLATEWRQTCAAAECRALVISIEPPTDLSSEETWVATDNNEQSRSVIQHAVPPAYEFPSLVPQNARVFMSVVILCHPNGGSIEQTLDSLALQDIDPSLFEVITMWAGYPEVENTRFEGKYRYTIRQECQAYPNDAAALNQAVERSSGTWVVFFDAGTILEPQNLRHHLLAQASSPGHSLLIGQVGFSPYLPQSPAQKLVHASGCWFTDHTLHDNLDQHWMHLKLNNVSVPRANLMAIGGFDAKTFGQGASPVMDFCLRLIRELRVSIESDATIVAYDNQIPSLQDLRETAYRQGYSKFLCWQKHPYETSFAIESIEHPHQTEAFLGLRKELRQRKKNILYAAEVIQNQWSLLLKPGNWGEDHLHPLMKGVCAFDALQGLVHAGTRLPSLPETVGEDTTLLNELTTVVMCTYNGLPDTQRAIQSIREHTDGPVELIVVDNGSTDGTLEWLSTQTDIRLVALGENLGVSTARNRGLERAHGAHIVFCDNDVVFTANWRETLLEHLNAWPDIGAVGPVTNHGSPKQRFVGPHPRIDDWAKERALSHADQYRYTHSLDGFCLVIRRDIVDDIGGFDEVYFPMGFEVEDFCIRMQLAGWRLRIVDECALWHEGQGKLSCKKLGYETIMHRNWQRFKTMWSLPETLLAEHLDLGTIVKKSAYEEEEHRIPYRSAEGHMDTAAPLLLVCTRAHLTRV